MSLHQRIGTAVVALLFTLLLAPTSASADATQPPIPEGSNAVGACLDADQVWLLVVDMEGQVKANQCVGTPASGEEALTAGGMQLEKADGMICALSGTPESCPATFNGSYWNYLHTTAGAAYTYSQEGADTRTPQPGDIEAWCYNSPEDESCEPPLLTVMSGGEQVLVPGAAAADYFDPAVTGVAPETTPETDSTTATTPWPAIGVAAVVILGLIGLLLARRRTSGSNAQVGGR